MKAVGDLIVVRPIYENAGSKLHLSDGCVKELSELYGIVESIGPDWPHKELSVGDKVRYIHGEGTVFDDGTVALEASRTLYFL